MYSSLQLSLFLLHYEQMLQSFTVELCRFVSFGLYLPILLAWCGTCRNTNFSFTCCIMSTEHQMAVLMVCRRPPAVFDSSSLEELRQLSVLRMTLILLLLAVCPILQQIYILWTDRKCVDVCFKELIWR